MLYICFVIRSFSASQYSCERTRKTNPLGLDFLEFVAFVKDPKELNINSSKRRLKGEVLPIHIDLGRTSNNAGIINLPREQWELEAKDVLDRFMLKIRHKILATKLIGFFWEYRFSVARNLSKGLKVDCLSKWYPATHIEFTWMDEWGSLCHTQHLIRQRTLLFPRDKKKQEEYI